MNQRQLYYGFRRAQKVYGQQSIHVNLLAIHAGVTPGEIVDYIESNPNAATTRMVASTVLGDRYESYGGMYVDGVVKMPFLSTESVVREGENGATIVLSLENNTFKNSTSTSNFDVDAGNTGLVLASCSGDGATKTLVFSGIAKTGKIKIMAKAAGMNIAANSDIIEIPVEAMSLDASTISQVAPDFGTVILAAAATGKIDLVAGVSLDFTAKTKGVSGNKITVTLVDPGTNTAEEVVEVDGNDITVTLAYDTNAVTSTAASVKTKLDATPAAAALIDTAITGEVSTLCIDDTVALDNGVDGTVAKAGKHVVNGTKIWIATTDCTIANSGGWKSISFDS